MIFFRDSGNKRFSGELVRLPASRLSGGGCAGGFGGISFKQNQGYFGFLEQRKIRRVEGQKHQDCHKIFVFSPGWDTTKDMVPYSVGHVESIYPNLAKTSSFLQSTGLSIILPNQFGRQVRSISNGEDTRSWQYGFSIEHFVENIIPPLH